MNFAAQVRYYENQLRKQRRLLNKAAHNPHYSAREKSEKMFLFYGNIVEIEKKRDKMQKRLDEQEAKRQKRENQKPPPKAYRVDDFRQQQRPPQYTYETGLRPVSGGRCSPR